MIDIRPVTQADSDEWLLVRNALWPDEDLAGHRAIDRYLAGHRHEPLQVLLAVDARGKLCGVIDSKHRRWLQVDRILRAAGIPPSRQRPMAWRTFMQATGRRSWRRTLFTTEVWTARGLVTYYWAFVLEFSSSTNNDKPARLASGQARRIPEKVPH